ncbi:MULTISPECIES: phospholipase D family protein [unclassified Pseudomonas]|uniref:phospholipase D family protein n=1 Tax=unclassified Pseudomonas TaxID=196821 RepID=UPI00244C1410|nr:MULTISPECIES: phospholipase D family protein [unclassified Pseudomonas]MDH0896557.1 phospholipase D family protein [Pseudomonas sp. GD03875]MDH1066330.1 phospholipase D family protein [Pseudomonas sp. GD03985]
MVVHRPLLICLLALLAACAAPPAIQPSQTLPPAESSFGRQLHDLAARHQGQSGFRLLPASDEAFAARAELVRAARGSLDLQYYIVHDGLSTRSLIDEVLGAADRGVRVRLLLDDTSSDGRDYEIALLAAHPNIQVRVFNPLHLGRSTGVTRVLGRALNLGQQHRRMHNKLWLADGSAAIVGGRNLGDEYFDAEPSRNFTDIDLLAVGPVAEQLAHSFDQYWNSALSKPIQQFLLWAPDQRDLAKARQGLHRYLDKAKVEQQELYQRLHTYRQEPRLQHWLDELIWAPGQALWDAPAKVLADGEPDPQLLLATQLEPRLSGIERELILVSAYFVPAEEGMRYLTGHADAGVNIRLLTNSLEATDVPAVHGGYAPYRRELLEHGVRLFELRRQPGDSGAGGSGPYSFSGASASSLHSKAIVMDGRYSFVGSLNFDPRSLLWNTEVGVLVDSVELSGHVRRLALEGMQPSLSYEVRLRDERVVWLTEDNGRKRELAEEPGSTWRRFNAWFAELIGLERML